MDWKGLKPYWNALKLYLNSLKLYWNALKPYWNALKPYWNGSKPYWNGSKPYWNGLKPYWNGLKPYLNGQNPRTDTQNIDGRGLACDWEAGWRARSGPPSRLDAQIVDGKVNRRARAADNAPGTPVFPPESPPAPPPARRRRIRAQGGRPGRTRWAMRRRSVTISGFRGY